MKKQDQLENWIKSLPKKRLAEIAYVAIDRLIETEEVRMPEEGEPYWTANGEGLDE